MPFLFPHIASSIYDVESEEHEEHLHSVTCVMRMFYFNSEMSDD